MTCFLSYPTYSSFSELEFLLIPIFNFWVKLPFNQTHLINSQTKLTPYFTFYTPVSCQKKSFLFTTISIDTTAFSVVVSLSWVLIMVIIFLWPTNISLSGYSKLSISSRPNSTSWQMILPCTPQAKVKAVSPHFLSSMFKIIYMHLHPYLSPRLLL